MLSTATIDQRPHLLISKYLWVFVLSILFIGAGKAQSVYKTPYGEKYHRYECRSVKNVSEKISIKSAVSEYGLRPCKICKPAADSRYAYGTDKRNKAAGVCTKVRCKGWAKSKNRQCKRITSICNGYCHSHQR